MSTFSSGLKPTCKAVSAYYDALACFEKLGVTHEGAVRSAFQNLLEHCARLAGRTLVPEYRLKRKSGKPLEPDGAIVDSMSQVLRYGLWEAKDTNDDLEKEIKVKFKAGYPKDNIIFQEPKRAILYQNDELYFDANLADRDQLIHVLDLFFAWQPPAFDQWERAVEEFKGRVRELGGNLAELVHKERQTNAKYREEFEDFLSLCRAAMNPNLAENAVEEMVVQHLLTERIFRKVFDIGDFMRRNIIAQRIEKVIEALTSRSFSRDSFVKSLEHFYAAIEQAAETIADFSEKQRFLNTVYERFFQGFCVKVADTHGIVYTPQPLVDFMVASVEHVLKTEFNASIADRDVHILDPFTGTGNFIVNLMRLMPKSSLLNKYRHELHCNELMLLPYYVASMNIEHAFWEAAGTYEAFEGICLVDTFETAEKGQKTFDIFNEANTERVRRQLRSPIKVIIANPPYNAGQANENDNNKNRKYEEIDRRVRNTYGADSKATLVRKLSDPYVKAIRFAADRIGEAGVVCYVNNNSFIAEKSFDGMRKHLARDFDAIYVLDLGGNVRKHPTLSGTTHNVFGIQVGVSINLFIRLPRKKDGKRNAIIHYHAVPVEWCKEQKYDFLNRAGSIAGVKWRRLKPDERNHWLTNKTDAEFARFIPLGSKNYKALSNLFQPVVFHRYSLGVSTNRDAVVYDFDAQRLERRVARFIEDYNAEVDRWRRTPNRPKEPKKLALFIDQFVRYERIKWSRDLKLKLAREQCLEFSPAAIIKSLYRPFTELYLYNDKGATDRPGPERLWFPTKAARKENKVIIVPSEGGRAPFWCYACNQIPNLNFVSIDSAQCFPLYTYKDGGKKREDNIPLIVLQHFQRHFKDKSIVREDIFYYVYAVLHHPRYREVYAANLKRELPRVPLVKKCDDFRAFAAAGRNLIDLHVDYQRHKPYRLKKIENPQAMLDWRVEAMKLNKEKDAVLYNDFLTLAGIPPETFDYRLGNRSALEWVIDQYRVTRNEQGNIISDPNRADDEQHIVRLIGQVIFVSLETMKIVETLPPLDK
jgi:predicted helicase